MRRKEKELLRSLTFGSSNIETFFADTDTTKCSQVLRNKSCRRLLEDNLQFKLGIQLFRHNRCTEFTSTAVGDARQGSLLESLLLGPLQVSTRNYNERDCCSSSVVDNDDDNNSNNKYSCTTNKAVCAPTIIQMERGKALCKSITLETMCCGDYSSSELSYADPDNHNSDSDYFLAPHDDPPVLVRFVDEPCLATCPRILTLAMAQQLHDQGLSDSLQTSQGWERCFAISRDGDSFITLLESCRNYRSTILVIQTTKGHILGGFCNTSWTMASQNKHYFGTGESFLFAQSPLQDTETVKSNKSILNHSDKLQLYKWTGCNDYCQICDVEEQKLAMGGGGDFGLVVSDCFQRGQTGPCNTFGNPQLVPDNSGVFEIAALEIYGIVPLARTTSFGCRHNSITNNSTSSSGMTSPSWQKRRSILD